MHLDQRHTIIILDILARHIPEHEVWAFGSRVHGRGLKKFSDLDLAVLNTTPLESRCLTDLNDDFSESDLPIRVDVVEWATTDENFRRIIENDHETIQTKERA